MGREAIEAQLQDLAVIRGQLRGGPQRHPPALVGFGSGRPERGHLLIESNCRWLGGTAAAVGREHVLGDPMHEAREALGIAKATVPHGADDGEQSVIGQLFRGVGIMCTRPHDCDEARPEPADQPVFRARLARAQSGRYVCRTGARLRLMWLFAQRLSAR